MGNFLYKNITTHNFNAGDRIKYTDPDNPTEEHLIEVIRVSEDKDSSKKTLEVSVINSNSSHLDVGDTFTLIIDPTGIPLLGFVFEKDNPLSAIDEIYDVQDLIVYHLVAFLKSRHRSNYQASYKEIGVWFKSAFGEELGGNVDQVLKENILPVIRKRKNLFKIKQGGYVKYVGSGEHRQGRTRMGGNFDSSTRIVNVSKITEGFHAFVIGVLESGLLGNVEIKHD